MIHKVFSVVLVSVLLTGCASRDKDAKTVTRTVEPSYSFEGRSVSASELVRILSYRLQQSEETNKVIRNTPASVREVYVEVDRNSGKFDQLKKTVEDFVSTRPCVEFYETNAGSFVIREIFSCGAQGRPIG